MANLTQLNADLAMYRAARDAILTGAQSYSVAGRSLTRANLDDIETQIARIEARIARCTSTSGGLVKSPLLVG